MFHVERTCSFVRNVHRDLTLHLSQRALGPALRDIEVVNGNRLSLCPRTWDGRDPEKIATTHFAISGV